MLVNNSFFFNLLHKDRMNLVTIFILLIWVAIPTFGVKVSFLFNFVNKTSKP
ncbi:hypothetical protein PEB0150_000430 [Bartonella apis]|nr:hypothetical protein PEB0150_000430 [Bartonella apis]